VRKLIPPANRPVSLRGSNLRTPQEISRDMERDFFMSPQEAVEYGIIDTVITHCAVARSEAAA
jgi:ATP-dependent Clp protease, protease subunit